jgi:hypothetical protein
MADDVRTGRTNDSEPATAVAPHTSHSYVRYGDLIYVPGEVLPADVADAVRQASEDAYDQTTNTYTVLPIRRHRAAC